MVALLSGYKEEKEMNILIACEESQEVCKAFREKGHNAFSCDIVNCSGGYPEWHIKGDVLPLLDGHCQFITMDFKHHKIPGKWDMIIAFPPCTHLAISGARHFEKKRIDGRQKEGINFFCQFLKADCDKISIENPINIISGKYIMKWFPDIAKQYGLPIKPSQIIQPYQFGNPSRKATCLWLKGLPKLIPTNIVKPELTTYIKKDGTVTTFSTDFNITPRGIDRSTHRSKTFPGIAQAMAEQWV